MSGCIYNSLDPLYWIHVALILNISVQVEKAKRPAMVLFLIKYLMMLVVGIPSAFWVGSKKTCFEWANFLHGRRRKE